MESRARRRHDRWRRVERVKRIIRDMHWGRQNPQRIADHVNSCRHYLCGNPRAIMKGIERFPLRERRQILRESDES